MHKQKLATPLVLILTVGVVVGYFLGGTGGISVSKDMSTKPIPSGSCVRAGCSSQLCLSEEDVETRGVTTCEYADYYACYDSAKCERQSSGECGWTMSEELGACLNSYGR